jgi:hypothetical protein
MSSRFLKPFNQSDSAQVPFWRALWFLYAMLEEGGETFLRFLREEQRKVICIDEHNGALRDEE